MNFFKGAQCPREVTLFAMFLYIRDRVSYRNLEAIMAERIVGAGHATLSRRVVRYSPLIASKARRRKAPTDRSWCMDETWLKVEGELA